jgi:hypothetical protein
MQHIQDAMLLWSPLSYLLSTRVERSAVYRHVVWTLNCWPRCQLTQPILLEKVPVEDESERTVGSSGGTRQVGTCHHTKFQRVLLRCWPG